MKKKSRSRKLLFALIYSHIIRRQLYHADINDHACLTGSRQEGNGGCKDATNADVEALSEGQLPSCTAAQTLCELMPLVAQQCPKTCQTCQHASTPDWGSRSCHKQVTD